MASRIRIVAGLAVVSWVLASCAGTAGSATDAQSRASGKTLERAGLDITLRQPEQWVSVVDGNEVSVPPIEMGNDAVTMKIMEEGALRSQVMDTLNELTVKRGPRLTGSQNLRNAQDWATEKFREWGLTNVQLEQWGTVGVGFDRGPSSGVIYIARPMRPETRPGVNMRDPAPTPTPAPSASAPTEEAKPETPPKLDWTKAREVQLTALSWSVGTNGTVRGPVIREPKNEAEFEAVRQQLKGAWVLVQAPPALGMRGIRSMMSARYDMRKEARKKVAEGTPVSDLPVAERLAFEPIAGYISSSRDERVWTGAVSGWRDLSITDRDSPEDDQPHVQVRLSDYDFLNSRLADGELVEVEFNLDHQFRAGPVPVYNVIAEIKGSQFPDEFVIISGHLDSWDGPGSKGVTDNGTGSSVTMEAARILMAANAKPLRTIRFVLWSGEEQGLLGSKGYVESRASELPGISAVFVDDGGTGYQAGLQAANVQVDMLAGASAPVNNVFYSRFDKKFLNVDIKNAGETVKASGGSDHASFNRVGVPGFFWDEGGRAEYGYGWHTQNDTIDLAIEEYLIQSATNSAVVAYRLGCAPTLLPRAKVETQERRQREATPTPPQAPTNPGRS